MPGVSLITFSDVAWEQIEKHPGPKSHWCLDVLRANKFWEEHDYYQLVLVSGPLALREAQQVICDEPLQRRFFRHEHCSLVLQ